jgi:hypothetical protein
MTRRTAAVLTIAAAALLAGGCHSTAPTKTSMLPTEPSLIAGDKVGRAVFAKSPQIAWAQERPAAAFAQFPTRD